MHQAIRVSIRNYLNQAEAEWRKADDLYPPWTAVNPPTNEAPRPFKKAQRFASSKTGY